MSEVVASGIVAAETIQQFVDALTPIVGECKIHFDEDGIHASAVDSANVASINLVEIQKTGFESYESPGEVVIGVNTNRIDDALAPASSGDLVELEVDMETRHLEVRCRNISQSIALIDPQAIRQEPSVPDLDLPNEFVIEGRQLKEAAKVCDLITDHIEIVGLPESEKAEIVAEGDTDETTVEFGREETIDAKLGDETGSFFSIGYISDLAKPIPKDSEVRIEFGDEFPSVWHWSACGGDVDVSITLAPRIMKR